jgi:hypothetical protein
MFLMHAGQQVYSPRQRAAWLEKLLEAGVRRRAERLYEQLDRQAAVNCIRRKRVKDAISSAGVRATNSHATDVRRRRLIGMEPKKF